MTPSQTQPGSSSSEPEALLVDVRTAAKMLSCYSGLRCPSEHVGLRWADIDWDRGRIVVRSPKTEKMEGREYRVVPLFPRLRPYRMDAFEHARTGAEFVMSRGRSPGVNLRTQMLRIMAKAGVSPWPRLFHNLRSSRQTELAETSPIHVVCAWTGNTPAVAMGHYLQVHDGHFDTATAERPAEGTTQTPTPHRAELRRTGSRSHGGKVAQVASVRELAARCDAARNPAMTPTAYGDHDVGGG